MLRKRISPCLLLSGGNLVKGVQFKDHIYVGNAMNIVRIFNSKDIDELIFLSIDRTLDANFVRNIADELFSPFSVGGGIKTEEQAIDLISNGAEKIILNTILYENINIVSKISKKIGRQSVVAGIDIKEEEDNKYVLYSNCGKQRQAISLKDMVKKIQDYGAGELLIQSIDRDGTRSGFDINILDEIIGLVKIPIAISGGIGSVADIAKAFRHGADEVCSGTMFIFKNSNKRSVLVNVPLRKEIDNASM